MECKHSPENINDYTESMTPEPVSQSQIFKHTCLFYSAHEHVNIYPHGTSNDVQIRSVILYHK